MASYIGSLGLSSRRAPTAQIDDRDNDRLFRYVSWGFPSAGPILRILMAKLRGPYDLPWGVPAAGPRLYILIAELRRVSNVCWFRLSSRRALPAHTYGRAKWRPTLVVWGVPAAEPPLHIFMEELRTSTVGRLVLSRQATAARTYS